MSELELASHLVSLQLNFICADTYSASPSCFKDGYHTPERLQAKFLRRTFDQTPKYFITESNKTFYLEPDDSIFLILNQDECHA